ncbi:hypothetical protein NHX12_027183 [Muraenolepis orangiensis]|uniref:Lipocalin/cytosolic fatty-acid binding domain-containing protein n=1 Tax=Muraenolepis orangiensis TaxID=630683 RepID=A0A9Q0EGH0_9TELE|nr:hypothetical protein NHX12_027183 [Muraenolepis orangiensis]
MGCTKLVVLVLVLCGVERGLSASCVVDSFTYAGKWYALQKKDPEGLFLQDNISAEYTLDDDGTMTASSKGRVTLFGFWVVWDNHWIIDTDYDSYALTYACRSLRPDGSCEDGYALVFSRNPRGLPPSTLKLLRQKQQEICMTGQFQPVLQSGAC